MNDDNHQPFSQPADPYGAKANFDVNEKKLHTEGPRGFMYEVTNLLIVVGIIAVIIVLFKIL